jgi:hypothetical protein
VKETVESDARRQRLIRCGLSLGKSLQGEPDEPIPPLLVSRQGPRVSPEKRQVRRQGR